MKRRCSDPGGGAQELKCAPGLARARFRSGAGSGTCPLVGTEKVRSACMRRGRDGGGGCLVMWEGWWWGGAASCVDAGAARPVGPGRGAAAREPVCGPRLKAS